MKAVILAAGMGTRLRPLTEDTPKSLVKVCGEPIAERQIRFLKEKGINDITVVTGYLKEEFEYLKGKYGIKIIHNDKYNLYNNIYTIYLVRDLLADAYVTEADVYMVNNFFKTDLNKSTYFGGIKENFESEWQLKFDENNHIYDIVVGPGSGYINAGVSYWTKDDAEKIKSRIESVIEGGDFKNLYWDDVVSPMLSDLDVYVEKINTNDWFEIDCVEDFNKAEEYLKNNF